MPAEVARAGAERNCIHIGQAISSAGRVSHPAAMLSQPGDSHLLHRQFLPLRVLV